MRLYVRAGCHLCDEMREALQPILRDRGVRLELIDVDRASGQALADYGTRVPVLMSPEGECLSEYFLDEVPLWRYLDSS